MHRVVGVHVPDVAQRHLAQRLLAAQAGVFELRDRGDLPRGAGLAGQAALLDDAEEPAGVRVGDAASGQPLAGQRQQATDHKLRHRHLAESRPVQARLHAVARGLPEVFCSRGERHLGPDGALGLGEDADQTVVEGRVRHEVGDRRPGWQHPVLHTQVRDAFSHGVDGAVPAVDRAVMQ